MEVIVRRVRKRSQMSQGRKGTGMTTASEAGRRREVSAGLGRVWRLGGDSLLGTAVLQALVHLLLSGLLHCSKSFSSSLKWYRLDCFLSDPQANPDSFSFSL